MLIIKYGKSIVLKRYKIFWSQITNFQIAANLQLTFFDLPYYFVPVKAGVIFWSYLRGLIRDLLKSFFLQFAQNWELLLKCNLLRQQQLLCRNLRLLMTVTSKRILIPERNLVIWSSRSQNWVIRIRQLHALYFARPRSLYLLIATHYVKNT